MTTRRGFLGLAAGAATALLLPYEPQKFFLPPAGGWPQFGAIGEWVRNGIVSQSAAMDMLGFCLASEQDHSTITATVSRYGSWTKVSDLAWPTIDSDSATYAKILRFFEESYAREREIDAMLRYFDVQQAAVHGGIPRSALP
jgi:hypothetical protein